MRVIIFIYLCFISFKILAQQSKFSVEANYGFNGNFFVRSYDEVSGPTNKTYFYKKNFIGTIGGIQTNYQTGKKSSIFFGYNRSINSSPKNYFNQIGNADVLILDFKIRDINNIFFIGYSKILSEKKFKSSFELGPVLMYSANQTIMIENWNNIIYFNESNFKNSRSVEGGVFAGFHIERKIDNHFDLGLRFRVNYLISVSTLEMISLTPTLRYRF